MLLVTIFNYISLSVFLFTFLLCLIYQYLRNKYSYWKKKNVPHLKSFPLFGDYGKFILQKEYSGKTAQTICQMFPEEPYIGTFYGTEPALLVQDPDLLRIILSKDFYYFNGREISNYTKNEVFTENLFFTYGDRWKLLRQHLSPLFSSSKMKNMFHLINACNVTFKDMLKSETSLDKEIEIKSLLTKYTMDVICSCIFGVEANVMTIKDSSNSFSVIGEMIFDTSLWRGLKLVCRAIWPAVFYGLGLKVFPTEIDRFFTNFIRDVFAKRENKPSNRHDLIDFLLCLQKDDYLVGDSLNNTKTEVKKFAMKFDDSVMIAQCLSFFAAGFETSSSTMSFTLYEIAKNKKVQALAIQEVDTYFENHKSLNYACITDLPYLDACVDETLRLYPVLGLLTREVMEDHTLPTGLRLKRGLRVHIPVYHLHHNPDFFPEPEKYLPERFYSDNKKYIRPFTYMPFGAGPRMCIGMRFARMVLMAGLCTILHNYKVELTENTPTQLTLDPRALSTTSVEEIKVKLVPRTKESSQS